MEKTKCTLEEEFQKHFQIHKYAIIASALLSLEDIYEEPLLILYRDKYLDWDEDTRARKITRDMCENHQDIYDVMYEYCWLYIDDILPEDTCYRD